MAQKKSLQKLSKQIDASIAEYNKTFGNICLTADPLAQLDQLQHLKEHIEKEFQASRGNINLITSRTEAKGLFSAAMASNISITSLMVTGVLSGGLVVPVLLGCLVGSGLAGGAIGRKIGRASQQKHHMLLDAMEIELDQIKKKIDEQITSQLKAVADEPDLLTSPAMRDLLERKSGLAAQFFDACAKKVKALDAPRHQGKPFEL